VERVDLNALERLEVKPLHLATGLPPSALEVECWMFGASRRLAPSVFRRLEHAL
jgi:hypothetical protein